MNSAVVFLALAALVGAQEIHFAKPHYHTVVAEESGRAVPVAFRMHNVDSHGAAFVPVADKSAILSRSAFVPETAYLTESAFAPKSAILAESAFAPKSAILAESAFAPKSAILAGSAFAPKSAILAESVPAGRWATVMENAPESDMVFQGLRRFAPESAILAGSAFAPETAYLASSVAPKSAILAGSAFAPETAYLTSSVAPKSAILAGSAFAPQTAYLTSSVVPKSAFLAESIPASAGRWASIMQNAPKSAFFAEPASVTLSGARYMADEAESDAILKVVPAGRWASPKSTILADLEDAAESGFVRKVASFAPKAAIEVASPFTPVSAGRWAVAAPAFPSTYAARMPMAPKSWTVAA